MWADEDEEDQKRGWRHRVARAVVGLVLIGGLGTAVYFILNGATKTEHHAIQTVTRVTLPPPPPPPPPPPKVKPPEPDKVVEAPKIQEPKITAAKPPEKAPPKPQQPPSTPLTAEAGTGSNPYGLAVGDGSGNVIGGGGGDGKVSYLSYGRVVSTDVQAALRRDEKLRSAKFVAELRIWLDPTGKVTRVQLASSSGDPAVDSAVERSLTGLAMHEPPPKDMPQPIRLRTRAEPG
jgi:TonB family protein